MASLGSIKGCGINVSGDLTFTEKDLTFWNPSLLESELIMPHGGGGS